MTILLTLQLKARLSGSLQKPCYRPRKEDSWAGPGRDDGNNNLTSDHEEVQVADDSSA